MDKKELRKELLKIRGALGEERRRELSELIWESLGSLEEFKRAKKIGAYLDFGSEVKTRDYLFKLLGDKEIYVPRLRGREMDFVRFLGFDDMKPGAFGILEPRSGPIIEPGELDLMLVPGLGFTLKAGRLGYGGGYYDGYMPKTRAALFALAFEVQIRGDLPIEDWDFPIHGLVTEKNIYRF